MNKFDGDPAKIRKRRDVKNNSHNTEKTPSEKAQREEPAERKPNKGPCQSSKINIRTQISPMHCISPDKPKAPRMRPIGKSPLKSGSNDHGRLIKLQIEGEIEKGASPDNRSTTGSLGLNENPGTLVTPDHRHVNAPPDTFTSPLKKRVPK